MLREKLDAISSQRKCTGHKRQDSSQIRKNRLGARRRAGHPDRDGRVGRADPNRHHRHDLAHVRHCQSAPGRGRPVHRDHPADQHRPGPLRPRDAAADALRADDDHVGGRPDGPSLRRHVSGCSGPTCRAAARRPEPRPDALRDGGRLPAAAPGREPLAGRAGERAGISNKQ